MAKIDFAEATGVLRVLEKRLLSNESIDRLVEAPTSADALRLISQNSDYDFSAASRPEAYESVLTAEHKKVFAFIGKITDNSDFIGIFSARYDCHNLKVALKLKLMGKTPEADFYSGLGTLPAQTVADAVYSGEFPEGFPAYLADACKAALSSFADTNNPQTVDIVVDCRMLQHIKALSDEIGNEFIGKYVSLLIDYYNIKTLVRVKEMALGTSFLAGCLVPGGLTDTKLLLGNYDKSPDGMAASFFYQYFGDDMKKAVDGYAKSGNFALLEKIFANRLMEHIKKAKLVAFGMEVPFAYLYCKENEISQIRIIMTCKINNISNEVLRERLRDNYA